MAVSVKQLEVGDVVEIDGRRYDVLPDDRGGMTLEPVVAKTVAAILAEHGETPVSAEEFEELFGPIPSDGEG
jgi:hypothetical protein